MKGHTNSASSYLQYLNEVQKLKHGNTKITYVISKVKNKVH